MESSMAALDAKADWSGLWRQLSQLGWRQEQQRKSNTCYYIPPSMGSPQKSKSAQRDYYDTREQVREYLVGLQEAKSGASQRLRYESSRATADRPGKRAREAGTGDSARGEVSERDRKRPASPGGGRLRGAINDFDSPGGNGVDDAAAGVGSDGDDGHAESEEDVGEDDDGEERRAKEAAHTYSRGGRRARLMNVPKHLYTNTFAVAVHAYIKDQGMSQDALASRTGLRQQQISGWLFGKCSATMHEMVERTLRSWFQQRGVDLDTPGEWPDLAAEDKIKLVRPVQEPNKKQKTQRSVTSGGPSGSFGEEIPSDGSWFHGEVMAVTSDGKDAAPFWLSVCFEKRRATARKIRVRWLKATSGIGPEGLLAYTKDSTYVFDEDTDPEQIFADTVLFRTKRRVDVHDNEAEITLSETEFRGALDAAESYALANQTGDESDGSGSEGDEDVELSPEQQVTEVVKAWALKALIFSSEYETHGGLTSSDLMERFEKSKTNLQHEVTLGAMHSGILEAVQSALGKTVRADDIKTAEDKTDDGTCRYFARFRVCADMEGTGGWNVARALPQINPTRRYRKQARTLSPDPKGTGHSGRKSQADQSKSSPSHRRLHESLDAKVDERDHSKQVSADIDWAWLCQNCLARNLELATCCVDCAERRESTVDDIACADDGCNWACHSNGHPIAIFKTAVGYDTRMLLHKQTSKQVLQYAGNSDTKTLQSSEQALRDAIDHLIACVELESSSGVAAPEVLSEHPERPDRASCTFRRLQHLGLLENTVRVEGEVATAEELQSTHGSAYVESVIQQTLQLDDLEDCYTNSNTPLAAKVAAGTTTAVVQKVITGEAANGVAVVRPPGHHACSHNAAGFCFFNNVAVAARAAQKQGTKRILIVDWGIHHGHGIQETFYDDPSVLTVSMHRGDPGFFPQSGKPDELGRGRGEGFNINVVWSSAGMGDAEYLLAFSRVVTPITLQFQPELTIVAAGFDSGKGDPWGECSLTVSGFANLTSQLMALSGGKLVLVLEGGCNLKTVSHSLAACVRVMRGAPPTPINDLAQPLPTAVRDIRITENRAAQYWSIFGCSRAASIEEIEEIEMSCSGGTAPVRMHSQLGDLNLLTVIQLRKLCVTRKLGTKGPKVDLVAKLHADDRNVIDADRIWYLKGHKLLGRRLRRSFKGFGDVEGAVHAWHDKGIDGYVFHVVHDDGDEEDLGLAEVEAAIVLPGDDVAVENDDSDEDQPRPEGHWTTGEQRRFDEAMTGKVCDKRDWHAVSMHVGTRTIAQCKSYALAKCVPLIQPSKRSPGIKQEKGAARAADGPAPTILYETLYNRLHSIPLDDNDEVACNNIDSQFSDKELRFLIARNRSKFPRQLAMVPAQKETEPQPGSPNEDNSAKSKSRDRDVGKKDKIRLLLPLVRTRGLLPPSSAELALPARPARPVPLKQHKSGERPRADRIGEGRWSAEEINRYEEGIERFGPTKWADIAMHVGTRDSAQVRRFARRRRETAAAAAAAAATAPFPAGSAPTDSGAPPSSSGSTTAEKSHATSPLEHSPDATGTAEGVESAAPMVSATTRAEGTGTAPAPALAQSPPVRPPPAATAVANPAEAPPVAAPAPVPVSLSPSAPSSYAIESNLTAQAGKGVENGTRSALEAAAKPQGPGSAPGTE